MIQNIDLENTAHLARLRADAKELKSLGFEKMISFANKLSGFQNGADGEISGNVNVFRSDIKGDCLTRGELLKNAPDSTDEYFKVLRTVGGNDNAL